MVDSASEIFHPPTSHSGEENGEKNLICNQQVPELTASSSSECSLLTEKELDLVEKAGTFQLDTTCGGLEIRVGFVDKEFGADLSKKAQDLRSCITSTAQSFHASVLSTLRIDPQHQDEGTITTHLANGSSTTRSKQDEENQEGWHIDSFNMVRILLSEKLRELGRIAASNLGFMNASLLSSESTQFSCTADHYTNQPKACVEPSKSLDVPW